MKNKLEFKCIVFITLVYILIFQNYLQNIFTPLKYFDEFISVCSLVVLFFRVVRKHNVKKSIRRYDFYMIIISLLLLVVSLYSSFVHNYQSTSIVFSDCLIVYKFFLAYMLSQLVFDIDFIKRNKEYINRHVKIIIVLLFLLTISNYIFNIWPSNSYRYGIMSNQLFYGHPTYLAAFCMFLISLFIMTNSNSTFLNTKIYYLMVIFMVLSTLRFKAIGAILIVILIVYYYIRKNSKISFYKLGIISLILVAFAWEQISFYYIDKDDSARKNLTETSIKIANDFFPLGTGFGTFGSYYSAINYSPVYYKYNISNIYGISKDKTSFITDTFWPMIIGQFGYMGLICYALLLLLIFKKIQLEFTLNSRLIYYGKIICFIYLIISSTSEAAFVNPIAIPLALLIGINVNNKGVIVDEK